MTSKKRIKNLFKVLPVSNFYNKTFIKIVYPQSSSQSHSSTSKQADIDSAVLSPTAGVNNVELVMKLISRRLRATQAESDTD